MLNFWVRLIKGKTNKISLTLYHKIEDQFDKGEYESEWLSSIKSTLDQLQMRYLWDTTPDELNPMTLKLAFDQKLQTVYGKQWLTQIKNSSACDTYSIFKSKQNHTRTLHHTIRTKICHPNI